jgi:hypothetical protein
VLLLELHEGAVRGHAGHSRRAPTGEGLGGRPARLGDEEPLKLLYVAPGAPKGKVAGEDEAGGGRLPRLGLQGGKPRLEGAELGHVFTSVRNCGASRKLSRWAD